MSIELLSVNNVRVYNHFLRTLFKLRHLIKEMFNIITHIANNNTISI
jgi:hypothetical protein